MSVVDWLGACARQHPNRIAVIDAASGRRHTLRRFDQRANQIAHFCEQWVGLLPGDCIGLLSTPSDDVLQIVIAAGKLGLTALLLAPDRSSEALITSINQYEPRTLFYGLAQAQLAQTIWFGVDSVEHLIPLRGAVDTANFEDIVAYYPPVPPLVERQKDVPWVRFTADATTWPGPEAAAALSDLPVDEEEAVPVPLHHPQGLATAVTALQSGQCVIIEKDSVKVIESPGEAEAAEDEAPPSQRNVPQGRSWLPHEFL